MTNQNSNESNTVTAKRGCGRPKPRYGTSGGLATFVWRRDVPQEIISRQECKREDVRGNDTARVQVEHRFKTVGRVSFGFFRNIKKYLQIKNLCRSKQKSKEADTLSPRNATSHDAIVSIIESYDDPCRERERTNECSREISNRLSLCENELDDDEADDDDEVENSCHSIEENVDSITTQCSSTTGTNLSIAPIRRQDESTRNVTTDDATITQPVYYDTVAEVSDIMADVPCSTNEMLTNENKTKASLTEELINLSKYGWYWGPMSAEQADAKLISEPDGAFLVRDSSDDRYVLTLSFKSSGNVLHSRMDHSGGLFSLCNQRENESFTSVAGLINHSMNFSQSAVFCYSRPSHPGLPSFPVRLTKPVSRFMQVKSLQYLCRFVIRQNTSLDNIHKMPLPEIIKLYILEAHY